MPLDDADSDEHLPLLGKEASSSTSRLRCSSTGLWSLFSFEDDHLDTPMGRDDDKFLYEMEKMTSFFTDIFSRARLCFAIVIIGICAIGRWNLSPSDFTSLAGDQLSVTSREGCQYHCESTHSDLDAKKRFGGVGICHDDKGRGLAKFEVCNPEARKAIIDTNTNKTYVEHLSKCCSFRVVPETWKPYFVFSVTAFTTFLIFQNLPAEICLMSACCIFAAAQIITPGEAFRGIANPAVVAIGFLFPIAAAVEETGILKSTVMPLLGKPGGLIAAIPRMFVIVMLLSGFLSNTAMVAMMIPLLKSWARQLKVHPGKLFMNLTYAGQLGGSITLIGSSNTLVAAQSVSAAYVMTMFDTFPIGVAVGLITMIACVMLSPTSLLQSGAAKKEEDVESCLSVQDRDQLVPGTYWAYFLVADRGTGGGQEYIGLDSAQLEEDLGNVPGVLWVKFHIAAEAGRTVAGGELLNARATAEGVVQLRSHKGLMPANREHLKLLGGKRERRHLFEGAVDRAISLQPKELRLQLKMAIVATRSPNGSSPWDPYKSDCVAQKGDVVLFEANPKDINEKKDLYTASFTLVAPVKDSLPPRRGTMVDRIRKVLVLVSFCIFVFVVSLGLVKLHWGAGLLITFYFVFQALNTEMLYKSINGKVLLAVGSAFGIATAVQKTGLATFVANRAMSVGGPYGTFGMAAAVYVVACVLSMFVNNAAVVAMMGPMLIDMVSIDPSLDLKGLTWVMIMASGACFCTPLGYQTNLMVQPAGEYLFTDFARFGVPVQLVHAAASIALGPLMAKFLG